MWPRRSSGALLKDGLYGQLLESIEQKIENRCNNQLDTKPEVEQSSAEYIRNNFWIKTKDKRNVLLRFNAVQEKYWQGKTSRDIILKFRQPGFSTLKIAEYFERVVNEENVTAVIVAHDMESTQKLFKIVQLMYDRLPEEKKLELNRGQNKPKYGNRREYFFLGNNSSIYVGTAGSVDFGRSQTINYLLCSEVAFWPNPEEIMTGLLQAVPYGGEVCIETTANGVGNYFYREYQEAKQGRSRFKPHFFAWFEHDEYRLPLGPAEVLEYTAEERALAERHGLTPEQIKWRRWKISEMPDKDGLSKEDRFRQEYPEDDSTCFLYSGRPALNLHAVQAIRRRAEQVEPIRFTIDHVNGEIIRDEFGELLVWDEPMFGRRYVLGADVAEGKEKGDFSCGQVLDWETAAQCAEMHGHWDPDIFAKKLAVLGCWYNGALIGPERNNHGHSVLNTLVNQVHYPNLYYHVDLESVKYKESDDPGWPTTPVTRPVMMADLKAAVREEIDLLGVALLDECQSFIVNAKGKEEAQPGSHDDRVMALAIALQLRKQEAPGIYF